MLTRLMFLALATTAAHGLAFTRAVQNGTCPEILEKQDFQVPPYLGRWFEIERFAIVFQSGMDCVQAIYSDLGDGTVEVHNTARDRDGTFTDIIGSAAVIAPGTLLVSFPGGYPPAEYHVLDTDYETYASVYNCDRGVSETSHTEYAWILSRTAILDAASYDLAVQAFTNFGINLDLFKPTYQGSDCPYLPALRK